MVLAGDLAAASAVIKRGASDSGRKRKKNVREKLMYFKTKKGFWNFTARAEDLIWRYRRQCI